MRALRVFRFCWGSLLVLGGTGAPVRLLGVRHVVQAALLGGSPRAGAVIDGTHAVSMLGLAATSRRWRGPALISAALAGTFTGMELVAAG